MELISIEFTPVGELGWGSGELKFGKAITQLYAKTGSGKTPIISAISYALGYYHEFRNDIVERCHSTCLKVRFDDGVYLIDREISNTFNIEVSKVEGEIKNRVTVFDKEKDFSVFIFEKIGYEMPELSRSDLKKASVYVNTLFPLYVLDQLGSYNELYKSLTGSFIKDQPAEMIRIALGITPKNPFGKNVLLRKSQDRLEALNERIVSCRNVQSQLVTKEIRSANVEELRIEEEELKERVNGLKNNEQNESTVLKDVEASLRRKKEYLSDLVRQKRKIISRKISNENIRGEIDGEVFTLSINEQAANAFRKNVEVCRNTNCGLFGEDTRSYGKELLYLKDQIKNLESVYEKILDEEKLIDVEVARVQREIDEDAAALEKMIETTGLDRTLTLVSELSSRLVDIILIRSRRAKFDEISENIVLLETERERIQDETADLKSGAGEKNILLEEQRKKLEGYVDRWLEIIGTRNLYGSARLDRNFKLLVGEEKLSQFKGATRTRIVLAFHAALLELVLVEGLTHPGFFILDTPKQHELENEDFDRYIKELKVLVRAYKNIKVIFSATSYLYEGDENDVCWYPQFSFGADKMYLGSPSSLKL